jgi:predicted AAA+ superfamily ATPase
LLSTEIANRLTQFNPWVTHPEKAEALTDSFLPPEYVHRHIEDICVRTNQAILVVGPRQAGKSTMVWHLLRQYTPDILFLNMEDPLLRAGKIHPIDLVEHIQGTYPFIKAIFIDEIQHMEEAGLFVKGLVDARLNVPVWVTGSSSFDLLSKTRESLAGRATRRRLLPFSMAELVHHANAPNPLVKRRICEQVVSHQLIFGSYPAIYLCADIEEKIRLLNDLVDALILRDASDLFKIKRVDAFRRLLPLLAGQIGNLVNLSELASICNVDVGTISAYIELLSEGHIVERVQPFAGGKRREITGTPKIFFIDNGIRNQLLNNFSQDLDLRMDRGQLLENWVFSEIHKVLPLQSSLKFWRSKAKAEVDFVIEHANSVYALEVKFTSLARPKLSRSAWSFVSAYKPEKFAVLNMALEQTGRLRDIMVDFITPNSLHHWLADIVRS